MIKKYVTYVGILLAGLILGYLIFGNNTKVEQHQDHTEQLAEIQYTCSMHPQVLKNEEGKCPLCGMDLVKTSGSTSGANRFEMTENAMALANIETTTVGMGSFENKTLVLSGTITSNDKTKAVQTTIFDGRIEKLTVNFVGEYVKKGQQIGVIYAPEMYAAQDKMLTSASYKDSHEKLWAAARNTLGLWKMTDAQINEVLKTGKPMENFPLIADVSGTVTEIIAAEGKFYKQGDPLFKVSNLYTVWAVFDAYENQLPLLSVGQNITITSRSFEGKTIDAKISFIEPIVDNSKRTVSVRVTLNNQQQLLRPGMFVQGAVAIDGVDEVLTVPKSAVLWTGKRSLVYLKPDPKRPVFEMAEVTLGKVIGDSYMIVDGLTPGDEVVVNGTFTVDAAAQLQGKKSMMAADNEKGGHTMDGHDASLNFQGNFQEEFSKLISDYIALKDALVATDAKQTTTKANTLLKKVKQIDFDMQNEKIQMRMRNILKEVESIALANTIEKQRDQFKSLSENMIAIASNFKGLAQPIYVQHCPMADNNKGANWLSLEDKVLNPYFGDKMLTCGSVTQTIE
ncbi:MAG: efflux RND transporter periplasmic adaptor subunit [Flavobacteriaceae bacterium]